MEPPSSPDATSSSKSSDRPRFRTYHGPLLPEIESGTNSAIFFDPFAHAFGNGGMDSRNSLTRTKSRNDAARKEAHDARKLAGKQEADARRRSRGLEPGALSPVLAIASSSDRPHRADGHDDSHRRPSIGSSGSGRTPIRRDSSSEKDLPISSDTATGSSASDGDTDTPTFDLQNEPDRSTPAQALVTAEEPTSPSPQRSLFQPTFAAGPRIRNDNSLRPHGTFTSARQPKMGARSDQPPAVLARTDDRFDIIRTEQLATAAAAGDQIAEAHLRSRKHAARSIEDGSYSSPSTSSRSSFHKTSSRARSSVRKEIESVKASVHPMRVIPEDKPASLA